jgi:small redox-active disulfide protein 2
VDIQVLGSGCPTCKNLYELTKRALEELLIDSEVEYLTGDKGTNAIIQMGIMNSPVLTINGKPVMVGFTPDIEVIKKLIKKSL